MSHILNHIGYDETDLKNVINDDLILLICLYFNKKILSCQNMTHLTKVMLNNKSIIDSPVYEGESPSDLYKHKITIEW